jgi:23S rRNA pseudouridine1911/1915/1917 synthase
VPIRLDLALIRRHPALSRRRARDVIEKGQVTLAGRVALEPGALVDPDARIEWDPNRKARSRVRPSVPVLYEDDDLLVVDKPAGLLAVPTSAEAREDTVLGRLQEYAARRWPGRRNVDVVHRLDRDT